MFDLSLGMPSSSRPLADEALAFFADALESEMQVTADTRPSMTLAEFIPKAWSIVEPGQPFSHNWHIDAISEHLQGVTAGHIKNLLINIPPGCMKSRLVSVIWPAWEWSFKPHLRFLCATYDQALSTDFNIEVRSIVESDWYQETFPLTRLRKDQNQKTHFSTTQGGWRIGTSVNGRGTGKHPHRKIVDDPHNVKKSESELERAQAIRWFDKTLQTRGVQLGAATIVIMQRLNELDLSGHILENRKQDGYVHLCLPMRYEMPRHCVTVGSCKAETATSTLPNGETEVGVTFTMPQTWEDPRTEEDELLFPELFPNDVVETLEADEALAAGQLQQRPAPEGGVLFKVENITFVDARPSENQIAARCRAWDAAGTSEEENKRKRGQAAFTAGALVSITYEGIVYIEDMVRERVGPGDDEKLMKQVADLDGADVRIREEQEPGSSGKKVIASHGKILAGYDFEGTSASGDKVTKARPLASQVKLGNVRMVKGDWNKVCLAELRVFPNGKFKDQTDAIAIAFNDVALDNSRITVVKTTYR